MDLQEAFDIGFDAVKGYVDGALASFDKRIAAMEARELPVPKDGKDADPAMIRAMVSEAVAALPPAKDGRDADPATVAAMVADAVAALPKPKDGQDGRSVDLSEVAAIIVSEVDSAVAAIPKPKDGHSPSVEELSVAVEGAVQRAVAALPVPKDGEPGRDGKDGRDGNDGAPGKLPAVRAWSDAVHYEGAVVTHDGALYQAARDTGRAPPHEDWVCIVAAGRDGIDGRSFSIRGTWAEAESYGALDVVALNGASFAARRDNPGPCPGDGWQLIASQGKRGSPGENAKGLRGDPGPAGPGVKAVSIDEQGILALENADGSTVTCDLYPLLSKL